MWKLGSAPLDILVVQTLKSSNIPVNYLTFTQTFYENFDWFINFCHSCLFQLFSASQNYRGQPASIVTLRCSPRLHLSPPPLLHRTQSLTPGELWEGKGRHLGHINHSIFALLLGHSNIPIDSFAFPPSSRSSAGRERGDKPLMSAPPSSRPGPFIRGGSSKELLESQTLDEPRRDREREGAEPRRPSVTEDKAEPERNRVREAGETHSAAQHCTYLEIILKTSL